MAGRSEEILSFVSENNQEHNEGQGEDRQNKKYSGPFLQRGS
jgi:hypothetical protein